MGEEMTYEELQAELGRLQGIETYWNATLAVLRRIDDDMPASAKLPGSPALEDAAYHLLTEYKQREAENAALKARVARLEAAYKDLNNAVERFLYEHVDWSPKQREMSASSDAIHELLNSFNKAQKALKDGE